MIGSIVLATEQGLGYLAKDFYDNGVIDKVAIMPHSKRTNHNEWYEGDLLSVEELLDRVDTLLFFETPLIGEVLPIAKKKGIKTVLMPMYECTNREIARKMDVVISPSVLDQDFYEGSEFIPVPVTQKWKLRKKAKVFVHNAGNGGLNGRNGTKELLKAMEYVKSPIKLIVRSQSMNLKSKDPRVEIQGSIPRETLYDEGDVFIFPEKFNGLSLPLQEAYASGMAIMATDRRPMDTWLPNDLLIPVKETKKEYVYFQFDSAVIDPKDIAIKIDEWYDKDISVFSRGGREWAKRNSWKELKSKYLEVCAK